MNMLDSRMGQNSLALTAFQQNSNLDEAHTLPASWYIDPQMQALEQEKIFYKTWQPVGRVDQVRRVGDFFTCEVQGQPLVVTRGQDGKLRGFYNVCLHRAGPVALGQGNRKSLQCKYHGWTYNLHGQLTNAPEFEGVKNWDKGSVCLKSVLVEEWGPWVFVNLDPDCIPLNDIYGPIDAEIKRKGWDLAAMTLVERRDYIVNCNWKVYVDNYLEGYHLPIAHPGLFRELDYDQYRVETFRYYSSQFAPIRPVQDGEVRDRRYVRTEGEAEALYYWIFPNVMLNIYLDNTSINIIIPLDHERTLTIFEWYFQQPGTGEGWDSMQSIIAFSDQIQQEDIEICENVQKGLKSKAYTQGRFSAKRENGVHHFQSLVHEFLTQP
jgi:choline monooxygenase